MAIKDVTRQQLIDADRLFHWPNLEKFSEEEATKTILYETPNTVGAIWCMKPGQTLPLHSHEKADDVWIVIQGEACFYPESGEKTIIKAGDIVVSRAHEKHGMVNNTDEDFVMLGIAGPTPIGFIPHSLD